MFSWTVALFQTFAAVSNVVMNIGISSSFISINNDYIYVILLYGRRTRAGDVGCKHLKIGQKE